MKNKLNIFKKDPFLFKNFIPPTLNEANMQYKKHGFEGIFKPDQEILQELNELIR